MWTRSEISDVMMTSRPWSRLYNPTKRCTLRNIWEWEPFLVTVMLLLIDMHHNNWNMLALSPSKTCVSEWNVVSNLTVWQSCAIVQYGTLSSPLSSGVSLSGKLGQWFTTDPTSSSLDPAHEKKWWDSQTSANERPGMCSSIQWALMMYVWPSIHHIGCQGLFM